MSILTLEILLSAIVIMNLSIKLKMKKWYRISYNAISYHGNSIVMRHNPYDTQKFMVIIRWEGKNNKRVFYPNMNKFWKHISVWKWLKIIVSIFILMSCQKIYVEHYCNVPHIRQKVQIWHTSQECPILNLCVTGLTISITILFIITSVATFSNDMKLVPDLYIIP